MMLENIEILLEHKNMSIDGIFKFLKNNDNYNCLNFIEIFSNSLLNTNDYEKIVLEAFNDSEIKKIFDNDDLSLLKGFFSILGKTDLQGQISNCRLYKEFFKQKLQILESEENLKCKSTSTIIIGTGIMFIIVLI